MGEKDYSEKLLEDYNDVFADIVNVLLFDGNELVLPDALEDAKTRSQYKADNGRLHEMERDVVILWKKGRIRIALVGLENQTEPDKLMPVRVMGYDGTAYRSQLLKQGEAEEKIYPVITIVLYFGLKHWNYPKNLKEILKVPKEIDAYVNDYRIHIFEIAWLSDETVAKFKSDFRVVADFFTQLRRNNNYIPSRQTIKHVDGVLKFLTVFGAVKEFKEADSPRERKVCQMSDVIKRMIDAGRADGLSQGISQGIEQLILNALKKGKTAEAIVEFNDVSLETVKNVQEKYKLSLK